MQLNKKWFFLFLSTIVALTFGAVLLWQFFLYPSRPSQTVDKNIQFSNAVQLLNKNKLDDAVVAFEQLVSSAPNKTQTKKTRAVLAFTLFMRNQGDDRRQAVAILKEIITDKSATPFERADATMRLLSFYSGTRDEAFARELIFKGAPFESLLNGDVPLAIRRAYETADNLYPLSLVEFHIAYWYEVAYLSAPKDERPVLLQELRRWTKKGETNLPAFLVLGYPKSTIGRAYEMLAADRTAIATYTDRNFVPAEAAFKEALAYLESARGELAGWNIELFTRFYYANMLAKAYGGSRKSDIASLLMPVIGEPPEQFKGYRFLFFDWLQKPDPLLKTRFRRLAALVPEFHDFLQERGIQY